MNKNPKTFHPQKNYQQNLTQSELEFYVMQLLWLCSFHGTRPYHILLIDKHGGSWIHGEDECRF